MLSVHDLSVTFGVVRAVDSVSLSVPAATLVGLIGPNGAGKTTTIDAITGFVPHQGRITFDGVDLTSAPPHKRALAGVARTWQSLELFDDLSVKENCRVAAERPTVGRTLRELIGGLSVPIQSEVQDALELVGLAELSDRYPGELSLGQRKLAAVARALASWPRALLLDEPAAGLDSKESRQLGRRIRQIVDRGIGVMLVDHDMGLVLSVCDVLHVLEFGRVIASGTPSEIRADPRVIDAYLGEMARP